MKLHEIAFQAVLPFKRQAERERVSITDTRRTHWFSAIHEGERVGFGAFIWMKLDTARVKGIYIFPEHRGQGYGGQMTEAILDRAKANGAERLEAFAHNPSFYVKRGWHRTGIQLRNGAVKVAYP